MMLVLSIPSDLSLTHTDRTSGLDVLALCDAWVVGRPFRSSILVDCRRGNIHTFVPVWQGKNTTHTHKKLVTIDHFADRVTASCCSCRYCPKFTGYRSAELLHFYRNWPVFSFVGWHVTCENGLQKFKCQLVVCLFFFCCPTIAPHFALSSFNRKGDFFFVVSFFTIA